MIKNLDNHSNTRKSLEYSNSKSRESIKNSEIKEKHEKSIKISKSSQTQSNHSKAQNSFKYSKIIQLLESH